MARTPITESAQHTQRVLGILGLGVLGSLGLLSILGILLTIVMKKDLGQASEVLTALAAIASACVGALAGWLARGHLVPDPNPPAPVAPQG